MSAHTMRSIRTDVLYALRQLREHRCIDRAIDALERIGEATETWVMPEELFDTVWDVLAGEGLCDDRGGAEYVRVQHAWMNASMTAVIGEFIRAHANAAPSSRPDIFPPDVDDVLNLSTWEEGGAINPRGPAWKVEKGLCTHYCLIVRDVGPWDQRMTITNGIESVLQFLLYSGGLCSGQRFLYFDSDGQLTEAMYERAKFLGFRPGVI